VYLLVIDNNIGIGTLGEEYERPQSDSSYWVETREKRRK
jgi:hypothetical protein